MQGFSIHGIWPSRGFSALQASKERLQRASSETKLRGCDWGCESLGFRIEVHDEGRIKD